MSLMVLVVLLVGPAGAGRSFAIAGDPPPRPPGAATGDTDTETDTGTETEIGTETGTDSDGDPLSGAGVAAPQSLAEARQLMGQLGRKVAEIHRNLATLVKEIEDAGKPNALQTERLKSLSHQLQVQLNAVRAIQQLMADAETESVQTTDTDTGVATGEDPAPTVRRTLRVKTSTIVGGLMSVVGTALLGVAYLTVDPQMTAPDQAIQLQTQVLSAVFVGGGGVLTAGGFWLGLRGKGRTLRFPIGFKLPILSLLGGAKGSTAEQLLREFLQPLQGEGAVAAPTRRFGRGAPVWDELFSGFESKAQDLLTRSECALKLGSKDPIDGQ